MKFRMCQESNDCIRACVATLINRDDVPHVFGKHPNEEAWAELRAWLESHGKYVFVAPVEEHAEFMNSTNHGIAYILLHQNARGEDHAVICRNGEVIHDPAQEKSPIIGHHSQLGCYLLCVIGDAV